MRIVILNFCFFIFLFSKTFSQIEKTNDTTFQMREVVITSTKAVERKTPATFSNIEKKDLQKMYSIQDIPEILSSLPSITTYSEGGNGIGYNYISLRGFDQRRISVMINGVPQNDPEDHNVYWIDFPDLLSSTEFIQVQRGAGSSFYGPPAIGGSVNLIANPFTTNPEIKTETMFGFQKFWNQTKLNTKKFSFSINSGLVQNKYQFFGKLGKITSNGYRENSWVNLNSFFLGAVRYEENFSTRVHIFGGPIEDGLSYYGLPKQYNSDLNLRRTNFQRKQEIENFSQPHFEILNDWKFNDNISFYNTMFYYTGDGFFDYDGSWTDTSMLRIGVNYGIPTEENPTNTLIRAFVGNKQFGILPRVEFTSENLKLKSIFGIEFRKHRSIHWGKIQYAENLPQNFDIDYHFYEYNGSKNIFSIYSHNVFELDDKTSLMGDLQIVRNEYEISNEKFLNNNFTISYLFFNPKFGVNYNLDENSNLYFSTTFTSREPRLQNLYSASESFYGEKPNFYFDTLKQKYDFKKPNAKEEKLFDFEWGYNFKDEKKQIGVNFYLMEFFDELVKKGKLDIFGQPVTGNAKKSRHFGIEVQGKVNIIEHIDFIGNFSSSKNIFIDHKIYNKESDVVQEIILDKNPIAGFPNLLGNLKVSYSDENINVSLASKYVGSFYTDNFKNEENKNDAFNVFDLELLYFAPKILNSNFLIRLDIKNLFNKLYTSYGEEDKFFPAAERNYLIGITSTF